MEMREKNLVILAAGIGSRFKGGIKQLQPVGPAGECIMEYSIYDALEAGFNRVVFIIRREIEPLFNEAIGDRLRRICQARGVESAGADFGILQQLRRNDMEMREKNLVILAAGIGSRFKGGIKQLQPVGPAGECIMEYSIYDALEAGFNRVVFIIRREIEPLFNEAIGDRLRRICQARGVEMICVYQDLADQPGGLVCPEGRTKPWGTGHALLSCRGVLHGGFAVINADDFYGKEAYRLMSEFLDDLPQDSRGVYGLAGFRLGNTLSDNGGGSLSADVGISG